MVLGFTEPECGSDVAAAQTRAVRDGEEWVINGSKMFTTNAQEADYAFMLTRTNPDVAKHKGLTTFVVPLRQEGVEIRPVYTLSGERTNLTFYNDVRVDDSMRIGEVDGGWDVMTLILTFERTGAQGGWSAALLEAMERWAAADEDGATPAEDPGVRARLGRAAAEVEVSRLLARRCAWMQAAGLLPGVEGSMAKLFASEAITRQAGDFVDLLGPDGIRSKGDPGGAGRGRRRVRLPLRPRHHHLRRDERGAAQRHRPARPGPAPPSLSQGARPRPTGRSWPAPRGAARGPARRSRCAGSRWCRPRSTRPGSRATNAATARRRGCPRRPSTAGRPRPATAMAVSWNRLDISLQYSLRALPSGPGSRPRDSRLTLRRLCSWNSRIST